jgi:phosphoribosylamine--glycine ligase
MNILLLGAGGREHALAWKIAQSPLLTRLWCAPGNAGIAEVARCVPLAPEDAGAVVAFCRAHDVDLVVIGPEAPLAAGVADALIEAGVPVFGPTKAAAALEASKQFAKEIADAVGAPTAPWARFDAPEPARDHVRAVGAPIVIKADGLAAGKGVVVAETIDQAIAAIDDMFAGAFGAAGAQVVIERFMTGEEASFFVLSDGKTCLPLATAQDHKRAFDGDLGPNTGGMGAYSPAPVMTPTLEAQVMSAIVQPVIDEMARRGTPFRGILYAGLMIEDGSARLVEFNVRFGDPECQALMMRLSGDLLPALLACANGTLDQVALEWHGDPALSVVIAAAGYPGAYAKGAPIGNLAAAAADPGVEIFHAGTARVGDQVVSNGGRVLNITARGATLAEARAKAYAAVALIHWPGGMHRTDIGWRALG